MRLTLRTLLAYMDDILEPADHADLGTKIEASDFASELIHRSRDTVRRLRLGAPAVLSDGSDDVLDTIDLSDANSVAEYLDNTLPPEQVADFERMCLEPGTEPDMHLAEVASCHHVLTMVLGEPAEVDADLKSRMYQLPARVASGQKLRIEPAHVTQQAAPPVQAGATPVAPPLAQPASRVDEHKLPDYLREAAASKRRSRLWAIGSSLLALGGLLYWFANPPEADPPAGIPQGDIAAFDNGDLGIDMNIDMGLTGPGDTSTEIEPGAKEPIAEAKPFVPPATPNETAPPAEVAPTVVEQPAVEPEMKAEMETVVAGAEAETVTPPAESAETTAAATAPPIIPIYPETKTPEETDPKVDLAAVADAPMTDDATGDATGALADAIGLTDPEAPADEEPAVVDPARPQRLGNYVGNNDVLLIHEVARDKWVRMPPRSPISTGDELLTLPKFRTHVVLADVNAHLSGGTRVHLPLEKFNATASGTQLNLDMVYGRLLLNAGMKGSQVAMRVNDQLREFQMESSGSLAVDVERVFVPGSDFENQAAQIKATWYLTSGSIVWPTAAGGTQTIEAPAMWKTIDGIDEIPEPFKELPTWVDRELVTDVERRARDNLAAELAAGKSVGIRLLELTDGQGLGRQKEVRILAAAASVYVGEFEPLVKALNDSDQKRAWGTHVEDLRQALALSPEDATHVRQAFVRIRGEEAAEDLMEMVIGYNAEQIGTSREAVRTGALAQLIKWLDHDSLDYRVLAIHNIRQIVGKVKGYRPDDTSKRRKIHLRKLWEEFEDNELLPQ